MNRFLILAAAALLPGCYDADTWSDEYITAKCAQYETCGLLNAYGGSVESCETYHKANLGVAKEQSEDWCEDFDADTAKECLHELEQVACEDLEKGNEPAECEDACPNSSEI